MSTPRALITTWRGAVAVLAVSAFLTFVNPFGATASLPAWAGYLYWTLLVAEGWFGATLIGIGIRAVFPTLGSGVVRALATVLVAFAVTGTIIAVQELLGAPVPTWYWPRLYGLVLGISAGVAAVSWLTERAFAGPPGAVTHAREAGTAAQPVRFMERLPTKLKGAAIFAVSAEDHYLRVHTSKGSDLILMRLGDAIAELEGLEGAQTHRSWWVARDAVEGSRRDGDKITLLLKGGAEAPVSRPNVRPLREAGWF